MLRPPTVFEYTAVTTPTPPGLLTPGCMRGGTLTLSFTLNKPVTSGGLAAFGRDGSRDVVLEGSGGTQPLMFSLCSAGPVPSAQHANNLISGLLLSSTSAIPKSTAFFPLFPVVPPAAGQTSGKNGGVSSSTFLMAASTLLLQERHTLNGILNGLSESKALSNWSFVEASSAAARRIARRPAVFDRSWSHVPHIGQNRGFL